MAVLFMDSVAGNDGATKWTTYSPESLQTGVTPSGGNAYRLGLNGANIIEIGVPNPTSVVTGWHWRMSSLSNENNSNARMYQVMTGTTERLTLTCNTDGAISIRRGSGSGTLLVTSATGVLATATWAFMEVRSTLAPSTGRVEVWVNGSQVINFTGDTLASGSADQSVIRWSRCLNGSSDVGDIYIADATIPLGPCRPVLLLPNAVGNSSGLTPNGAGDNYTKVNEATPDGDTTYNASDTEGVKDTYGLGNLPAAVSGNTWDVLAVQTVAYARKSDSGSKFMRPVVRTGGTDYAGSSVTLAESYDTFLEVFDENPGTTAAWTAAQIDALEAGIEVRDS
jgi:hypothetical protein